jgi:antitoxin CptB
MQGEDRLRKLNWLCRRGMKELDILLQGFTARHHNALNEGAWPEFEELLQTEDDLLWDWLMNPPSQDARGFSSLLDEIRRAGN